jgi:hypothetical protein
MGAPKNAIKLSTRASMFTLKKDFLPIHYGFIGIGNEVKPIFGLFVGHIALLTSSLKDAAKQFLK